MDDKMMLIERLKGINRTARENFDRAQGQLEMLNDFCGTRFGFLNKRVVIFRNPDADGAELYAHCNDAVATLEWEAGVIG